MNKFILKNIWNNNNKNNNVQTLNKHKFKECLKNKKIEKNNLECKFSKKLMLMLKIK